MSDKNVIYDKTAKEKTMKENVVRFDPIKTDVQTIRNMCIDVYKNLKYTLFLPVILP